MTRVCVRCQHASSDTVEDTPQERMGGGAVPLYICRDREACDAHRKRRR